jgi:hypothetical protein
MALPLYLVQENHHGCTDRRLQDSPGSRTLADERRKRVPRSSVFCKGRVHCNAKSVDARFPIWNQVRYSLRFPVDLASSITII